MSNQHWYYHHGNVQLMLRWLLVTGATAQEIVEAHEKPWQYREEYEHALQAQRMFEPIHD